MNDRRQSAVICPSCRKLISRGEARCPYCGISSPESWWRRVMGAGLSSPDHLIKAVIYLNVGMYVISILLNPRGLSFNPLQLLSPANRSLLLLGATGTIPIDGFDRWWTLISANYLHGGILHIFFNMMAFRQLAPLVLQEYGLYRSVIVYTLGGTFGFFISYLAGVTLTIGASAAVCAMIGSVLYFAKSRGGYYGQALYRQVGGWAVGLFLFGFIVPGINNWAHGGGIFAGAALGYLLGYREWDARKPFHRIFSGVCAGLTLAVLAYAVLSGIYYRLLG